MGAPLNRPAPPPPAALAEAVGRGHERTDMTPTPARCVGVRRPPPLPPFQRVTVASGWARGRRRSLRVGGGGGGGARAPNAIVPPGAGTAARPSRCTGARSGGVDGDAGYAPGPSAPGLGGPKRVHGPCPGPSATVGLGVLGGGGAHMTRGCGPMTTRFRPPPQRHVTGAHACVRLFANENMFSLAKSFPSKKVFSLEKSFYWKEIFFHKKKIFSNENIFFESKLYSTENSFPSQSKSKNDIFH